MARLTAHLATAFGTRREGSRAVGLDRPWAVHITGWLAGERGESCFSSPHVLQTADCRLQSNRRHGDGDGDGAVADHAVGPPVSLSGRTERHVYIPRT
jgi:hypothetical protein